MKRSKKASAGRPESIQRLRASLLRKNRQVIYLNDQEVAAVNEYCRRFGISYRSALYREAIMERVLDQLKKNHPTLF